MNNSVCIARDILKIVTRAADRGKWLLLFLYYIFFCLCCPAANVCAPMIQRQANVFAPMIQRQCLWSCVNGLLVTFDLIQLSNYQVNVQVNVSSTLRQSRWCRYLRWKCQIWIWKFKFKLFWSRSIDLNLIVKKERRNPAGECSR